MSRIVLTTMGSLGDLHPLISIGSSLRDRGHQVVFATFEIYRNEIVHQGGIGTTAQALRSSRPTLVTPYSHDQPDNAARLVRLGTSRTIKRDRYRVDRVARELKILLEHPSYADRAAAVGRVLESENGTEVACNAIERSLKQV
jgi:rhamnosyltransferase subunit B